MHSREIIMVDKCISIDIDLPAIMWTWRSI